MSTNQLQAGNSDRTRFGFGKNGARYLALLSDERIAAAEQSLKYMLEVESLAGKRFLDAGSGSGLFSLAARNLGASVYSFDYDIDSVNCTQNVKARCWPGDAQWQVEHGDLLDVAYLGGLGQFDVVYSWGVLHHTGNMWQALDNLPSVVRRGGQLFIAIYNDQGRRSEHWKRVKRVYNKTPSTLKWIVLVPAFIRLWGPTTVRDIVKRRPFSTWWKEQSNRGMSPMIDVVDWVGGWPFEVARPEEIFNFYRTRGFELTALTTRAGGHGCNEFVFRYAADKT